MTPSPSPEQMEAAGKIIEEIRNRYVWEKPDTVQMVASVLAARDAAIVKPLKDAIRTAHDRLSESNVFLRDAGIHAVMCGLSDAIYPKKVAGKARGKR